MKYYIKKRFNPQFDKPYFITCGKLTAKEAKKKEKPIYGMNIMLPFNTQKEYDAEIERLKKDGFTVNHD